MFELYNIVKLLSLKSSNLHCGSNQGKVEIIKHAWREEGEVCFLALLCSNDQLLLRHDVVGHRPVIKQLPWLPDKSIASMSFDPSLTWLLVVTESAQEVYVIPALSLVDPEAAVNQIFKTEDVTVRTFKCADGNVSSALWWQSLDGRQIAVVATDVGEIIFVDLMSEEEKCVKVTIDVTVTNLALSQDDMQMNTTLLITTVTGNQWRLLLESRTNVTAFSVDPDINDMGYDNIDGRTIPPRTILDGHEEGSVIFQPAQFLNFQPPTLLRPQYAKGRHFITAHCTLSSTLEVMDSDAEHSPLFVYKLPTGAENVILSDKLIFAVVRDSRDRRLMVLSSQKSENLMEDQQEYSQDAIVQEFVLPQDEPLIGVECKRYPFYYHEHNELEWSKRLRSGSVILPSRAVETGLDTSVLGIPVTTHTVLDGCVVVTSTAVYEIRPCISPERLFLHLSLSLPETSQAERLAICVGLDLTTLSELAADFMLRHGQFTRAMKLYTLSKKRPECPATKRTGGLARYGCISETMIHLRQVLSSPGFELNTSERKYLSNMLLHCFVYQLNGGGQATANVRAALSDFLTGSFSFNEQKALTLLSQFGEVDLLLTMAKARGMVVDALVALVAAQSFRKIPFSALSDLVQRGFSAHLIQSGKGSLLPCLPPADLVRLLITRPQLTIQNCRVLRPLLPVLKAQQLLDLAKVFDPSKSVLRGILQRLHTSRRRNNSLTSLTSVASEAADFTTDKRDMSAESLIEFFLLVVIYLNHCRQREGLVPPRQLDFNTLVMNSLSAPTGTEEEAPSQEVHRRLTTQTQPVACGPKHAAAVRNGDLYTWGRSLHGRLGHGEVAHAVCPPVRVETLHMLRLRVEAVACGNEHTLALTQQGVYGWGNSRYGQVGVGMRHMYRRPMLLEVIQSEAVVALDCGHYHSLALTADHQVYSWGWGVHGQLGHGNPEDCLVPTHIHDLLNAGVVKIAAGYAHSLVLTDTGDVWTFGCGYFGQLGLGTNTKSSRPHRVVDLPLPVVCIATKYFHCIAVSSPNKVFTWGCHPHNLRQVASAMRQGRTSGRNIPQHTSFLSPSLVDTTYVHGSIVKVCCGSLHSVAVTDEGCIYVWGRNLEGQLGTGSRQDERVPKMLTAINEQNVVSCASGGEFTQVMDVDGVVWLWGKNDSGQLGYMRSRHEHSSRQLPPFQRYPGQLSGSEVSAPCELRGLPPSDPSDPQWSASLATLTQHNFWSDGSESDSDNILESLPQLDQLGSHMYDSSVIPVTLQAFESVCTSSMSLQKCVDLGDCVTAGHISCLEENFVQALHYRLTAVMEDQLGESSEGERVGEDTSLLCARLVAFHIRLIQEKARPGKDTTQELKNLCSHALYLWQQHNLVISHLEEILSQHLTVLAPWLLHIVLRLPGSQTTPSVGEHVPLSTSFTLQVLTCAMTSGGQAGPDWRQIVPTTTDTLPHLSESTVPLQNPEKLTPKDQLLADILRNMKKDSGVISLTHSQLDYLDEQQQRQQEGQSSVKSIVFSCGHHFNESVFKSEVLPNLARELTSGRLRLSNSASLLHDLLTREGLRPSACPKCITRGLMFS